MPKMTSTSAGRGLVPLPVLAGRLAVLGIGFLSPAHKRSRGLYSVVVFTRPNAGGVLPVIGANGRREGDYPCGLSDAVGTRSTTNVNSSRAVIRTSSPTWL